ncbi:MAG: BON domain-containing protein [Ideonella sp.]
MNSVPRFLKTGLVAGAAATALLLGACSKPEDQRTVGQQVDSAIASAERQGEIAKKEIKQSVADARQATSSASSDLKARATNAADAVSDKVQDAAITASVNAELAKDPDLSALKINVDTVNGRVSLKGAAPDESARERATRLASAVKGVIGVENRLEIRS